LENNQDIHFTRRLVDNDEDEEGSVSLPEDPLALFKDLSIWKPPLPSTPAHFTDMRVDPEDLDDVDTRVETEIIASPHKVNLVLPKNATIERTIEMFQKMTCLDGTWEGRITSDEVPRVAELRVMRPPSFDPGDPKILVETRIFFGTLKFKHVFAKRNLKSKS
jgi:hypothetical protein